MNLLRKRAKLPIAFNRGKIGLLFTLGDRQGMYFVYILKSIIAKKSYVGITDNIDRRLREHNDGKSKFTKKYMPWQLIYSEKYQNRVEARKREKYFKSAAGRVFLRNKVFKD